MNHEVLVGLKSWFAAYSSRFRVDDPVVQRNYDLKEFHTDQVCRVINALVDGEGLDDHWRLLAEASALLHDVGRFRQFRDFGTFRDADSLNHAALSVQVVKEEEILKQLPQSEKDRILLAIRLHNVFVAPANLSSDDSTLLKLLRDADKLDIWRVFIEYHRQPEAERASAAGLGFPDLPHCTDTVINSILRREMVQLNMLKTLNDFKLLQLSWVFDLNYPTSFKLLMEKEYVWLIAKFLPATTAIRNVIATVTNYVEEHSTMQAR